MERLIVRGAREHNLKGITVELPKHRLIVFTGISGSGKSSLAFDTIFAEGQRRYIASLSAYARQFLGRMRKPDVESIEGLSPAIAIDQKGVSHNPRSTVGTVTEIYDYLRLLYARVGHPHCPRCGRPVTQQSAEEIVNALATLPPGTRFQVLAPLVRGKKGHHRPLFEEVRSLGFLRVRVDGQLCEVDAPPDLERYRKHDIEAVVDRLIVPDAAGEPEAAYRDFLSRLTDSVETALRLGDGLLIAEIVRSPDPTCATGDRLFSEKLACPHCNLSLPELEPRTFSFNSPQGACPVCQGLGYHQEIDPALLVPDPEKSLAEGAIAFGVGEEPGSYSRRLLEGVARAYDIPLDRPWRELTEAQRRVLLYGTGDRPVRIRFEGERGHWVRNAPYEGVIPNLRRRYEETQSDYIRSRIESVMRRTPCAACGGTRLNPVARAVTVAGQTLPAITAWSVKRLHGWTEALLEADPARRPESPFTPAEYAIARLPLQEVRDRLRFLVDVGLDYLTLARSAATLSGGEAQRIRLATQVGSRLTGVLYVLDEPSIGLHPRDTERLLRTLKELRDLGNTVLVVEHDEATIRAADWIVDLGPGAGEHGGEVVVAGPPEAVIAHPTSLTGAYLSGRKRVPIPAERRAGTGAWLIVRNAREHNLKGIDVRFPLGKLICVTGVSGSGKSTLVMETLYRGAARRLHRARLPAPRCDTIEGLEHLDRVINIDQSPIGRTPRSNPATYTGAMTPIRELFAALPEAKVRGYKPGRFSFNVKGGRCEACQGQGTLRIEMQFLPEVYVPCDVCHGSRYNRETLQVRYKGLNIADVLALTVDEAAEFFAAIPRIVRRLRTLQEVGLGYIRLGQPAPTLSGGEAQRVKLAKELSKRTQGQTLYILDEPTVGLHAADVHRLIEVLHRLVEAGHTVIVIEHNPDVIKVADWIIDLGPEGGEGGGRIVAEGTPETVARVEGSYTGHYLRRWLAERLEVS